MSARPVSWSVLARTTRFACATWFACMACLASPSAARAEAIGAAPETRAAEETVLERVDLRDLPLSEACRLIGGQAGLNIVPSAEAAAQRVTLFLEDVPALTALESLCRAHQLWFQRDAKSGVIRVNTVREYKRDLLTFQDERIEYFTLLYPNAVDVGYAIKNLFGARVILRFGALDDDTITDLQDRFARFDQVDSRTQGLGFGAFNGQSGQGGNGGGIGGGFGGGLGGGFGGGVRGGGVRSGQTDPGLTGAAAALGQDEAAAAEARRRAEQVRTADDVLDIEGLLRDASTDDERRAAALEALSRRTQPPIRVTVVRRQNKVIVQTADERALEQIRALVRKLDIPTSMVLLEVRILSIDVTDGFSSFFEYQFARQRTAGAFTQGTIANPVPPSLDLGGGGLRAGDLTFQFVNDNFAARMQILETKNRVKALATPLLLTANNEVSRLFVGREVPLNRSFQAGQTVANQTSTTTVPGSTSIEFRPVGTTLLITPSINADRTVTLRIVQESSDVNSTSTVLVPSETGFVPQDLNVVSSQVVSGTIIAKSDLAVAFGGLIETSVSKEREQWPLLGDIPVLGSLFRREVDVERRREIIVVVRPFVLSTPAESEALSQDLLQRLDIDTDDAGVRRGAKDVDHRGAPPSPAGRIPFRIHGLEMDDR